MKTRLIIFFLLAFTLTGCTVGMENRFSPASHFVHPNSNVKILGPVTVEKSGGMSLFVPPPTRTSADDEKLYQEALNQQPGADVIVDFVVSTKVTLIPLAYFAIYKVTHKLEGFAAKKVVGQQELL